MCACVCVCEGWFGDIAKYIHAGGAARLVLACSVPTLCVALFCCVFDLGLQRCKLVPCK